MLNYEKDGLIPEHMRGGMKRYFEDRILPGSFLTAVLSNNLKMAVLKADDINIHRLPDYVRWLYWEAPATAWGSPERVRIWISKEDE